MLAHLHRSGTVLILGVCALLTLPHAARSQDTPPALPEVPAVPPPDYSGMPGADPSGNGSGPPPLPLESAAPAADPMGAFESLLGGGGARPPIDFSALGLDPNAAQDLSPEEAILLSAQKQMKDELEKLGNEKTGVPSLLFSRLEYERIRKALEQRGSAAIVPDDVADDDTGDEGGVVLEGRDIRLSGIFFKNAEDWIIWLNDQRLTPQRLPKQIKEIKVYKKYIEIKWADNTSAQTYAIRLRPNQRFNLDTQSFSPG